MDVAQIEDAHDKPVFSISEIKIADHKYTLISAFFTPITPANNSLSIKIKLKNNSNYSPATFWNDGFRLAIDVMVHRSYYKCLEQMGTCKTFFGPHSIKVNKQELK